MRLDNFQREFTKSKNTYFFSHFFLMTNSSLNRALGNSDYDWNWKGASKNYVTWKIEFTSFQPFFDPNDGRCCFMSLLQSWATQIGSRAKFMLKCHVEGQNRDFFYRFSRFSMKQACFRVSRRDALKSLKGRMRPAGRRLPMAGLLHTIDDLNIQRLSINDENIIQEDVVFDKNK